MTQWGFDACRRISDTGDFVIVYDDDDEDNQDDVLGDTTRRRRYLQEDDCPFVQDIFLNPCNILLCTDFGLNDPSCQEYIIGYCKENYAHEPIACAEYLDLFISCDFNVLSDD